MRFSPTSVCIMSVKPAPFYTEEKAKAVSIIFSWKHTRNEVKIIFGNFEGVCDFYSLDLQRILYILLGWKVRAISVW